MKLEVKCRSPYKSEYIDIIEADMWEIADNLIIFIDDIGRGNRELVAAYSIYNLIRFRKI